MRVHLGRHWAPGPAAACGAQAFSVAGLRRSNMVGEPFLGAPVTNTQWFWGFSTRWESRCVWAATSASFPK